MDYFFTQAMADICEHSLVSIDRPLRCIIIVNPIAGGFIIPSKWANRLQILKAYQKKAQTMPKRQMYKNVLLNLTEGKGSAAEITKSFVKRAEKDPDPFYLIISAGGDGTHGEIMRVVYEASATIRRTLAVLRLPMGTGNDGADAESMDKALDLLLCPSHIEYSSAVQLFPAESGSSKWKGPFLAFNILSLGLDAFVTHQTNIMKAKTPGNSYHFWLDIAALFYDKKFKVDYFDVRAFDANKKEIMAFNEKLLLLAMGASGHRSYGSQQHILPDDRNVCAIKQTSVFGKLALKNQVATGKHISNKNSILLNANRLEFTGKHPILAQMDGETILMQPDDFPAVLELTAPIIPLLKKN